MNPWSEAGSRKDVPQAFQPMTLRHQPPRPREPTPLTPQPTPLPYPPSSPRQGIPLSTRLVTIGRNIVLDFWIERALKWKEN